MKVERQEGIQRLFMFFDIFEKVEHGLSKFRIMFIEIIAGDLFPQKFQKALYQV